MRWRGWPRAVILLSVIGLAACSSLLKKPEIELASVELAGVSLLEQRFVLKLNVRNPNAADLHLKRLDFSVELDGRPFAQGSATQSLRVPSHGEAVLEVKAVSSLVALLERARAARSDGRDKMAYRIFGSADLEGVGVLPFERKGELPSLCIGCAPARGRSGSSSDDKPL